MQNEYIPIDGGELTQLQFMNFLYRAMYDDESLKKRLSKLGVWWRFKGLMKQLRGVLDVIWNSIEPAKRDRIYMVWENQELIISNSCRPVDPKGDMMLVPRSSVVYMAQHLQDEACSICLGCNSDKKDCKFRRALLDLALPDLRKHEKQTGKCVGHLFDWGN